MHGASNMTDENPLQIKRLDISEAALKFDESRRSFAGYASVFGGLDAYGDSIVKGAYKRTLDSRNRPVRMRWNHNGPVIGKWTRMHEDDTGLYVEGELTPGHSVAEDVYASLKHGSIDGLSIGYRVRDYEDRSGVRYLKDIDLVEVSVVEEPADLGARVGQVKTILNIHSPGDVEKSLKSLGLTRSQAKRLMASGYKAMVEDDESSELVERLAEMNRLLRV